MITVKHKTRTKSLTVTHSLYTAVERFLKVLYFHDYGSLDAQRRERLVSGQTEIGVSAKADGNSS